jgi:hypothetical protein
MKQFITGVKYLKEYETKFGPMHSFKVSWPDGDGYYSSKKKDQTYFVEGVETEFNVEEKEGKDGKIYKTVKPAISGNLSGFSKNLKKEQSRYSGFAVSYVKDLIIAGKVDIKQWEQASEKIFKFLVALDKTIENDIS